MSIYIGNDLEDRLKALEAENASLRKYNEYHQVVHEIDYISSSFGLRIIVQIAFRPAPGPERGSSKRGCKEKSHAYVTTSFSHFFVQPYKIQTCSWYIIVLLFTWKEKL